MAKQQKTYTREFKLQAVQLLRSSGKVMSQVAREPGISDSALYQWCKHETSQGEQAFPGSGHQSAQEEEIRRLKRELEVTKKAGQGQEGLAECQQIIGTFVPLMGATRTADAGGQ